MRVRLGISTLLFVFIIFALLAGWWSDHRRMETEIVKASAAYSKEADLNWHIYENRRDRLDALYESASQHNTPSPEVAAEVIDIVRHDPDWAIKVHAMAILPYLVQQREQAIDALSLPQRIAMTKAAEVEMCHSMHLVTWPR
jgi:hypothetical protein